MIRIGSTVRSAPAARLFHSSVRALNGGSLFGLLTPQGSSKESAAVSSVTNRLQLAMESDETDSDAVSAGRKLVTLETDKPLQEFIKAQRPMERPATELLLSPLRKRIYDAVCEKNGGFYKRGTTVSLDGLKHKLDLTKAEIDALEPSVYTQSYRIKSTMKKATMFLRKFRGVDLKKGITQCHFAQQQLGRDVGDLLERAMTDAKKLGLDADDLYIAQIWTGSDGSWVKRIDHKGRGRMGIIRHRYIHVKCVLRTKSVTKRRLAYERELKLDARKPWVQLADKPIRGVTGGVYKW
ncbi:mitochondrial 54S ribosomal protein uL22m KNAG_0F01300 [Huiozyma naganishii CBS 8797]|uniref:Ribosomal protein L22 n=1 Tax=Huiozyma naganishii (strain ATCC MYA-139 / BCRC 22969 / CBS 8797 / KCTC 17520 / NBRC 10181 / NCYC 3082 / Yp74L-3) TaxID=1071383 RepID=J7RMK4_HUIN7|nr:hypothetical protein KNAG_0F01300 [Kazachstania naganishii CBS 8797]CCK70798.1 hypothetical protein KNAG_0F01300 [Kazachstania naganishii CBS 8797]